MVSSVLRLIDDNAIYKDLYKFIIPHLFYATDKSDQTEALREILKILQTLHKDGQTDNFSLKYIETQIPIKIVDDERAKLVKGQYSNWLRDDSITSLMKDDGCLKSFIDYVKALQIYNISSDFGKKLQENNVTNAVEVMQQALQKISTIGAKDRETLNEGELFSSLQDYYNKSAENKQSSYALTLGCDMLDRTLGGFEPQTLTGFIAKEGTGKTMLAHHIIARCIEQGKYIWIAAVEDRKKSFTYRIMARLSGIPIKRLKNEFFQLTSEEKDRLKKADADFSKYVKVEFMYGVNISDVHKAALDWDLSRRLRGLPIAEVNIVDYTGHIAKGSAGEKGFEKMRAAYGERKDFILKNNKIGFDFAQVNREGSKNVKNNHLLTQNDLAGAYDIAQIFDNLISINRNDDDQVASRTRFNICKARDSSDKCVVSVKVNFAQAKYEMHDWDFVEGGQEAQELYKELRGGVK